MFQRMKLACVPKHKCRFRIKIRKQAAVCAAGLDKTGFHSLKAAQDFRASLQIPRIC